jgi:hypothetical protein
MKIKSIQEIEVNDTEINISINLKKQTSTITLSYTCPSCAGHGCRREGRCSNTGSISMDLDPTKIDISLDRETASKLRSIVQNLHASMLGDMLGE